MDGASELKFSGLRDSVKFGISRIEKDTDTTRQKIYNLKTLTCFTWLSEIKRRQAFEARLRRGISHYNVNLPVRTHF
jgi:hypothetical protein